MWGGGSERVVDYFFLGGTPHEKVDCSFSLSTLEEGGVTHVPSSKKLFIEWICCVCCVPAK